MFHIIQNATGIISFVSYNFYDIRKTWRCTIFATSRISRAFLCFYVAGPGKKSAVNPTCRKNLAPQSLSYIISFLVILPPTLIWNHFDLCTLKETSTILSQILFSLAKVVTTLLICMVSNIIDGIELVMFAKCKMIRYY